MALCTFCFLSSACKEKRINKCIGFNYTSVTDKSEGETDFYISTETSVHGAHCLAHPCLPFVRDCDYIKQRKDDSSSISGPAPQSLHPAVQSLLDSTQQ